MSRNIILALIAAALVSTNPAHAGEWKKQTHEETKIGLRIDAPWLAPEKGNYWAAWDDSYTVHYYTATWVAGRTNARIGIELERLAPQQYWRRLGELDEGYLIEWDYLEKAGVSDIRKMPCGSHECVAFKAGSMYDCAAFLFATADLGTADSDGASDIVNGYYCQGTAAEISTEKLDEIINSIAIKK